MKIRAWLNDDPNSNEMKTYIIPEDCRMSWDFNDRMESYERERKKHVKQMENEVIGLALICRKNGIYKDLFELLRDRYIFRPVKRNKKEDEENRDIEFWLKVVEWLKFILGCFVIITGILVLCSSQIEPPRSIDKCNSITCPAGPTGLPPRSNENYLGVPGPPGPTGPPGICL